MPDTSAGPPISFAQFVVSIGSSAMVHLGEIDDPSTGSRTVDLGLARHSIDVLALLQAKTRGNLDEEEKRLVDTLLDELRAKYAAVSRNTG